jgi:hypothetical protein
MENSVIATLGRSGASLFALGCATHVGSVVKHFGAEDTIAEYSRVIDELWNAINRTDVAYLRGRIDSVSDASIDDPYRRGYYAMRALGVVWDALETVSAVSDAAAFDAAKASSDGASSLANDLAYEANAGDTASLEEAEEVFQVSLAGLILQGAERAEVRLLCEQRWQEDVFKAIDRQRGWVRRPSPA